MHLVFFFKRSSRHTTTKSGIILNNLTIRSSKQDVALWLHHDDSTSSSSSSSCWYLQSRILSLSFLMSSLSRVSISKMSDTQHSSSHSHSSNSSRLPNYLIHRACFHICGGLVGGLRRIRIVYRVWCESKLSVAMIGGRDEIKGFLINRSRIADNWRHSWFDPQSRTGHWSIDGLTKWTRGVLVNWVKIGQSLDTGQQMTTRCHQEWILRAFKLLFFILKLVYTNPVIKCTIRLDKNSTLLVWPKMAELIWCSLKLWLDK